MRCTQCGWIVGKERCPCGASLPNFEKKSFPVGTRVVARPGRGPSMSVWMPGEVVAHQGPLHQVNTRAGQYWVESDDLLAESVDREKVLEDDTRVWALWLDGRWYPGTIDKMQGPLRHVTWDDGDAMWLDAYQTVVLAAEAEPPEEGSMVIAKRWDGEFQPARVEQKEGLRYRVAFSDGEEATIPGDDLYTFPPSPFQG